MTSCFYRSTKTVLRRPLESAQYTCIAFGKRCRDTGVRPSMGSVGDAYDNAMAESFFATLECELLDRRTFKTQAEARMAVFEFIEGFYNPRRRHSSLGYLSPVDYERHHTRQADPGAYHAAVVLRPLLKMRPGNVTANTDAGTTADLDQALRAPACQTRVGRDQGTGSARGTNKGTGQDKEDPHQIT